MKKYLSSMLKHALVGCMGISFWFELTHASLFFFGEYEYPKKEDYEG